MENDGEAADISVPIFNYGHYHAVDEATGEEYPLGTGENARITLNIPAGYTGTIMIAYQAPRLLARLRTCLRLGAPGQHRLGRKPEEKTVNTKVPPAHGRIHHVRGVLLWNDAVTCGVNTKKRPKQRFKVFSLGAFSTALEPLCTW